MEQNEFELSLSRAGTEDNDALLKYWQDLLGRYEKSAQGSSAVAERWQAYKKAKSEEIKNRGNEALGKGDNRLAILWFSLAILLDPTNYIFYSNRSAAYSNAGLYSEALQDAETVIQLNPQWAKGYSRKGLAQFFLDRYEEALETYKKGLELEPDNELLQNSIQRVKDRIVVVDLNERGEAAVAKGRYTEALGWYDQGIAKEPNDFLLFTNRSEAHRLMGHAQQALDDANRTIELRPGWAKGYQKRAEALLALGKYDDTIATCAHALHLDPNNQTLQKVLNSAVQQNVAQRNRESYEQKKGNDEKEKKGKGSSKPKDTKKEQASPAKGKKEK